MNVAMFYRYIEVGIMKRHKTNYTYRLLMSSFILSLCLSSSFAKSENDLLQNVIDRNSQTENNTRQADNLDQIITKIASQSNKSENVKAVESDIVIMNVGQDSTGVSDYQWNSSNNPILSSRSAVVMNAKNGKVIYKKNENTPMSIASITKLMSAMVFLDAKQDMSTRLTITNEDIDYLKGSSSRLSVGTTLSREELLHIALMSSENRAIHALARNYPGGLNAFIPAMNAKARQIGMVNSNFYDPTGLDPRNKATAVDLVKMAKAADKYAKIRYYTTDLETQVRSGSGKLLTYRNSNALVRKGDWQIGLQKTGYIREAGRCMIVKSKFGADDVYLVFLGAPTSYSRVSDAENVRRVFGGTYY